MLTNKETIASSGYFNIILTITVTMGVFSLVM